jgi:hypothetical protein
MNKFMMWDSVTEKIMSEIKIKKNYEQNQLKL